MLSWSRGTAAICAAFLIAGSTQAQSIVIPTTINVPAPGPVYIKATSVDADVVKFFTVGKMKLSPLPDEVNALLRPGTYFGFAPTTGTYKLGVVVAKSVNGKAVLSEPQGITVIVGEAPPTPPTPPNPPTPPTPTDPFLGVLQAAYAQETGPTKAAQTSILAALFSHAAVITTADATLKTVTDFQAAFHTAVGAVLPHGSLPNLSNAIGAELNGKLPGPATVLDAPTRTLIAAQYNRIAALLGQLK